MDSNMYVLDLAAQKEKQLPWHKTYINTTISLIGFVAAVASIVLYFGFDLPPVVLAGLVIVIKVAETLGIRVSKPAPTKASQRVYTDLVAEQVDLHHPCSSEDCRVSGYGQE